MSTELKEQSTELAPPALAALALKAVTRRAEFTELAKQSTEITVITNVDGYRECHAARMRLLKARTGVEKEADVVKEDAVKFQKAAKALRIDAKYWRAQKNKEAAWAVEKTAGYLESVANGKTWAEAFGWPPVDTGEES
jgi:hypothetical protein